MFKHILKYTLLTVVWKRYRVAIIATVFLFMYFWLVGKIHSDFILYSEVKDTENHIGFSFFVKWLSYLFGLCIYLAFIFLKSDASEKKFRQNKIPDSTVASTIDPFESVRSKQKLKSRSDQIIEKYPKK